MSLQHNLESGWDCTSKLLQSQTNPKEVEACDVEFAENKKTLLHTRIVCEIDMQNLLTALVEVFFFSL